MYEDVLTHAGLSRDEAEIYEALLTTGTQGAGELLKKVSLKRGLLYKVLHSLEKKHLIKQKTLQGKTVFAPEQPDILLDNATIKAETAQKNLESLEKTLPEIKARYLVGSERPALKYYEGINGVKRLYENQLNLGELEMYAVKPTHVGAHGKEFYPWYDEYRKKFIEKGVVIHGISIDEGKKLSKKEQEMRKVVLSWIDPADYTAPVEINVIGNQVAVISFGKELFGVVLENKHLAQGIRDLFRLAIKGAKK